MDGRIPMDNKTIIDNYYFLTNVDNYKRAKNKNIWLI